MLVVEIATSVEPALTLTTNAEDLVLDTSLLGLGFQSLNDSSRELHQEVVVRLTDRLQADNLNVTRT